ncbi:unnamed protein product [Ectocarpus sp. CCAP 1310/34]|nr:unnamed protein product [Ectocarpus sp. CCAP 1310/34]
MSRAATGARKMNDTAVSVGVSDQVVHHPSQKQLRELLQMLMGTPAGVVQQVGHLLMLFVAVIKADSPATDAGDGSGGSGTGCGNCGSQPQVARSAAARLRDTTAEERKEAIVLLQTAHKELKKNNTRGAGKAGKGGICVSTRSGPSDEAKAKGLQRWAAKGKRHVGQLQQLLLGSGMAVKGRQDHARLLNFHAKRISSEEAKKGSSAAAIAFEMMNSTINSVLNICGEAKSADTVAAGQISSGGSDNDVGDDDPLARKRSNGFWERNVRGAENVISARSPPSACADDVMDDDSEATPTETMMERSPRGDAGSSQETSAGSGAGRQMITLDGHMPNGIGGATATMPEAARAMAAQGAGITKDNRMARELKSLKILGSPHYAIELAGSHDGSDFLTLAFANADLDLHEMLADPQLHGGMSNLGMMSLFGGLVNGVSSIHNQGFAHGNINPKSVRVVSGKNARWVIRDFDSAGVLGKDHISVGLFFEYLAPEAMAYATEECNTPVLLRKSVDAYALGQIRCQVLARDPMPPLSAETVRIFAGLLHDIPSERLSVRALNEFASFEPRWESQPSQGQDEHSGTLAPPAQQEALPQAILGEPEKDRASADTKRDHRAAWAQPTLTPNNVALLRESLQHPRANSDSHDTDDGTDDDKSDAKSDSSTDDDDSEEEESDGGDGGHSDSGSDSDSVSGSDSGSDSDSVSGSDSGSNSDSDRDSDSDSDCGSDRDSDSGSNDDDDDEPPPPLVSDSEDEYCNEVRARGRLAIGVVSIFDSDYDSTSVSCSDCDRDSDRDSDCGSNDDDGDEPPPALASHPEDAYYDEVCARGGLAVGGDYNNGRSDKLVDAHLCLEEKAYPRCREGYESIPEGKVRWALSVIREITDTINVPTPIVALAAITLGVTAAIPGFLSRRSDEDLCLLPAACVSHAISRLDKLDESSVDLYGIMDQMLAITKAASEGRGKNGGPVFGQPGAGDPKTILLALFFYLMLTLPEELTCPGPMDYMEVFAEQSGLDHTLTGQELGCVYDEYDRFVRAVALNGLLRTLSPSDIARGAFFGAAGVSIVFSEQGASAEGGDSVAKEEGSGDGGGGNGSGGDGDDHDDDRGP